MSKKKISLKLSFYEFKVFSIVILISICGMLGIDIHLASMPSIMEVMHASKNHVQESVSLYVLGMSLSLFFYGPLSDKYGRKPIVIFGLAVASIASFSSVSTSSISMFLLARLIQGAGAGVCLGVAKTITADVLQGEKLAATSSYFSIVPCLSPLFAPALGGYMQQWFGWQSNFLLLGGIMLGVLLIYALFCPETNHNKNPHAMEIDSLLHNYKSLLSHRLFFGCIILTGIGMGAITAYSSISSVMFEIQFHLSSVAFGWIATIIALGSVLGKLCNPYFITRFGSMKTLLIGIYLLLLPGIMLAGLIFSQEINLTAIISLIALTVLGQAFISTNANAQALSVSHSKRGAAGALYGGIQMFLAYLCSSIVNDFSFEGIDLLAATYVFLGILGIVSYIAFLKKPSASEVSANLQESRESA